MGDLRERTEPAARVQRPAPESREIRRLLVVGSGHDPLERGADATADLIMRRLDAASPLPDDQLVRGTVTKDAPDDFGRAESTIPGEREREAAPRCSSPLDIRTGSTVRDALQRNLSAARVGTGPTADRNDRLAARDFSARTHTLVRSSDSSWPTSEDQRQAPHVVESGGDRPTSVELDAENLPVGTTQAMVQLIQRQKLADDGLNVVGEEHDISDDWRQGESFIAWDVAKGDYWGEHDLETDHGPADDLELLFKSQMAELIDEATRRGAIESVKRATEGRTELLANPSDDTAADTKQQEFWERQIVAAQVDVLERPMDTLGQALLMYEDWDTESRAPYADAQAKVKTLHDFLNRLAWASITEVGALVDEALRLFDDLTADFQDLSGESESLVFARSQHMHASAKAAQKKLGIWKIGDKHVTDDFPVLGGIDGVTVLTRQEFDDIYGDDVAYYQYPETDRADWGRGGDKAFWAEKPGDEWKAWFDAGWQKYSADHEIGHAGDNSADDDITI